jgi:hypothetical protein
MCGCWTVGGKYSCFRFSNFLTDYSRNHFGCIDIFEHFQTLARLDRLPEFEELEELARKLHRSYSSTRAHYRALNDADPSSNWVQFVPIGSPWCPPVVDETSLSSTQQKKGKEKQQVHPESEGSTLSDEFKGDRTLANSIAFLRDGILSREMAFATAEGDPGRVYEVMKVSLLFVCMPYIC